MAGHLEPLSHSPPPCNVTLRTKTKVNFPLAEWDDIHADGCCGDERKPPRKKQNINKALADPLGNVKKDRERRGKLGG